MKSRHEPAIDEWGHLEQMEQRSNDRSRTKSMKLEQSDVFQSETRMGQVALSANQAITSMGPTSSLKIRGNQNYVAVAAALREHLAGAIVGPLANRVAELFQPGKGCLFDGRFQCAWLHADSGRSSLQSSLHLAGRGDCRHSFAFCRLERLHDRTKHFLEQLQILLQPLVLLQPERFIQEVRILADVYLCLLLAKRVMPCDRDS